MSLKEISHANPYIIGKNLGSSALQELDNLPVMNSDQLPVINLSQEQKYTFDRKGWLLIPGVLSGSELKEMQEFGSQLRNDPQSIPEKDRSAMGGPLQKLVDHPLVVGFMNEFVAHPPLSSSCCYGFRMESCSLFYRTLNDGHFGPHNGNGLFRFPGDSHLYRCIPGKAYSGLSRVVWELNPVKKGKGGTLLVTGSHKAVYAAPESLKSPNSSIWDTYGCPEGSVLFFTEALTHSTHPWTNTENDRIAVFSCYNTVNSKWHDWEPHPELLAEMPPMRQTLFRPVRAANNLVGENYQH